MADENHVPKRTFELIAMEGEIIPQEYLEDKFRVALYGQDSYGLNRWYLEPLGLDENVFGYNVTQFTVHSGSIVNLKLFMENIEQTYSAPELEEKVVVNFQKDYKCEFNNAGENVWRADDSLKYAMFWPKNRKVERLSVGNDLTSLSEFEVEINLNEKEGGNYKYRDEDGNPVSSIQVSFDLGGPVETGWIGLNGRFKATLTNFTEAYPIVEISEVEPCYDFGDLPLKRRGVSFTSIVEITPVSGLLQTNAYPGVKEDGSDELDADGKQVFHSAIRVIEDEEEDVVVSVPSDDEEGEEDEEEKEIVKIKFKLAVDSIKKTFSLIPASNESFFKNNLIVENVPGVGVQVKQAFEIQDFNGMSLGDLDHGFVNVPTNLDDADLNSIDCQTYQYAYVELGRSDPSLPRIASQGMYAPCSIYAIPATQTASSDGQVYDRYYEVEQFTYVKPGRLEAGQSSTAWMDVSSTKNSFRVNTSSASLDALVGQDVPVGIVDALNALVERRGLVGDSHFALILSQLQLFLQLIQGELSAKLSVEEIQSLCQIWYSATIDYPTHSAGGYKETNGLFGWNVNGELYKGCKNALDNQMWNEFFLDYSTLKDKTGIDLESRAYSWILDANRVRDNEYFPSNMDRLTDDKLFPTAIFGLKWALLEALYKKLDVPSLEGGDVVDELF